MTSRLTALGNAGFRIEHAGRVVLVDPFFARRDSPTLGFEIPADLILITHDHWDHFDAEAVAEATERWPACRVGGPRRVTNRLRGRVPEARLLLLEAPEPSRGQCYPYVQAQAGKIQVRAYRTFHGTGHNSYLVEQAGLRWLHDGDNERTQPYDVARLGSLDFLFLCPWQGSAWSDFVRQLQPRCWVLQHLDEDELAQHRRGEFLPSLGEPVPMPAEALATGETRSWTWEDF